MALDPAVASPFSEFLLNPHRTPDSAAAQQQQSLHHLRTCWPCLCFSSRAVGFTLIMSWHCISSTDCCFLQGRTSCDSSFCGAGIEYILGHFFFLHDLCAFLSTRKTFSSQSIYLKNKRQQKTSKLKCLILPPEITTLSIVAIISWWAPWAICLCHLMDLESCTVNSCWMYLLPTSSVLKLFSFH